MTGRFELDIYSQEEASETLMQYKAWITMWLRRIEILALFVVLLLGGVGVFPVAAAIISTNIVDLATTPLGYVDNIIDDLRIRAKAIALMPSLGISLVFVAVFFWSDSFISFPEQWFTPLIQHWMFGYSIFTLIMFLLGPITSGIVFYYVSRQIRKKTNLQTTKWSLEFVGFLGVVAIFGAVTVGLSNLIYIGNTTPHLGIITFAILLVFILLVYLIVFFNPEYPGPKESLSAFIAMFFSTFAPSALLAYLQSYNLLYLGISASLYLCLVGLFLWFRKLRTSNV